MEPTPTNPTKMIEASGGTYAGFGMRVQPSGMIWMLAISRPDGMWAYVGIMAPQTFVAFMQKEQNGAA